MENLNDPTTDCATDLQMPSLPASVEPTPTGSAKTLCRVRKPILADASKGEEIWKDIKGYEGFYIVSNHGRVARVLSPTLARREKKRGAVPSYPNVRLSFNATSKRGSKVRSVHSLVAEAFIGPRSRDIVVNHKDGIKANNHISNLEYLTNGDNMRHAWSIGIHEKTRIRMLGESSHSRKLKDNDRRKIIERFATGKCLVTELSKEYKVSTTTIRATLNRANEFGIEIPVAPEDFYLRKLSPFARMQIWVRHNEEGLTCPQLASIYGVSTAYVENFVKQMKEKNGKR